MKKFLALLIFTVTFSFPALAGEWRQDATGHWWQDDDGSYPSASWKWIDGNQDGTAECYYFDESGYLLAGATAPDGYTVDVNGCWVVDGVVQTQAAASEAAQQNAQAVASAGFDYSNENVNMKYVSHELGSDKYGRSCVIIYYDYTNKKADAESAIWATLTTVSQNNIECDDGYLLNNDPYDNYFVTINPGETIRVSEAFLITDLSDITVTVREFTLGMGEGETPSQTVTLKLQ